MKDFNIYLSTNPGAMLILGQVMLDPCFISSPQQEEHQKMLSLNLDSLSSFFWWPHMSVDDVKATKLK